MSRVHVAAGVIFGNKNRILIARRLEHLHQGGLWEFPGGKIKANETVEQALFRELQEELAIEIDTRSCQPLLRVEHDYADKRVLLDFCKVAEFSGEPRGCEGQDIAWIALERLGDYHFPAANLPLIELLHQQFVK